jgi:hypothetical protein
VIFEGFGGWFAWKCDKNERKRCGWGRDTEMRSSRWRIISIFFLMVVAIVREWSGGFSDFGGFMDGFMGLNSVFC